VHSLYFHEVIKIEQRLALKRAEQRRQLIAARKARRIRRAAERSQTLFNSSTPSTEITPDPPLTVEKFLAEGASGTQPQDSLTRH
jgi:hypothetical protein